MCPTPISTTNTMCAVCSRIPYHRYCWYSHIEEMSKKLRISNVCSDVTSFAERQRTRSDLRASTRVVRHIHTVQRSVEIIDMCVGYCGCEHMRSWTSNITHTSILSLYICIICAHRRYCQKEGVWVCMVHKWRASKCYLGRAKQLSHTQTSTLEQKPHTQAQHCNLQRILWNARCTTQREPNDLISSNRFRRRQHKHYSVRNE